MLEAYGNAVANGAELAAKEINEVKRNNTKKQKEKEEINVRNG